jgi:hypothetical protein
MMSRLRGWWRAQNKITWLILSILLGIAMLSIAVEVMLTGSVEGLGLNLGTEIIGAVLTFALIDRIIGGSEEKKRLRATLIGQLGSAVNEEATRAAEELRRYGWLKDGTLQEAYLRRANLFQANLRGANLEAADLWDANLEKAMLWQANLKKATLCEATLCAANLELADLEGANLTAANLYRANLNAANLAGADLQLADLTDARFDTLSLDNQTILPDRTHWDPGEDIWSFEALARFTDPTHPDYWRSDAPGSPAYKDVDSLSKEQDG